MIPGANQAPTYESTINLLEPVALAAGSSRNAIRKDVTHTEIMVAGPQHAASGPGDLMFIWRSLSALMHGDQWATKALLDVEEVPELSDESVVGVRISSAIDTVAVHMGICIRWAEEAVALFVRRKTEPELER